MSAGSKKAPDKVQAKGLKCPAGHALPHKTKQGRCTTEWCALAKGEEESLGEAPIKLLAPAPTVSTKALAKAEAEDLVQSDTMRLETEQRIAEAHRQVRRRVVGVPQTIEDPEGYAQAKAVSLLPEAMAEIEYQLKYGDDRQRAEMADRVLDMTGNRKRDALAGGGQTIVLQFSPADAPSWADRGASRMTIDARPVENGTKLAKGPVTELSMDASLTRGEALRETEAREDRKKDALEGPTNEEE